MCNLSAMYISSGRHLEAEPLLIDSLKRHRQTVGDTHAATVEVCFALGRFYEEQFRIDEAEKVFFGCYEGNGYPLFMSYYSFLIPFLMSALFVLVFVVVIESVKR